MKCDLVQARSIIGYSQGSVRWSCVYLTSHAAALWMSPMAEEYELATRPAGVHRQETLSFARCKFTMPRLPLEYMYDVWMTTCTDEGASV
jgi:hypothetical protein